MELKKYFEGTKGTGVLSTADKEGRVDAAIYSRPHFINEGELAFIMADRLTHKNITENPYAVYLFKEDGPGYRGKRLHLTMLREEDDPEKIEPLRRRHYSPEDEAAMKPLFLVHFKVDQERELVGG